MSEPPSPSDHAPPTRDHVARVRRALLRHYDECRRELPWRGQADPYRVLVSEVMLQQTRVDTVLGYYGRWLERFPDLAAVADAEPDEVLKAWEGLGYYRRARNLHAATRAVRERPDGFPSTYAELRDLPGVGTYTAGAVASIAFGEAVPAVDGNVRRVLARLYDEPEPKDAWLRERAAELVDPERPGDWNQALMELGATVCAPRAPSCGACPVARWCGAHAAGTQLGRPKPPAKRRVPETTLALAVLQAPDGRVLLERRPNGGLLGGMWAFPEREVESEAEVEAAALTLAADRGLRPGVAAAATPLPTVRHRFTHLAATYVPWLLPVSHAIDGAERAWIDPAEETDLPVPVAQRTVLDLMCSSQTW